MKKIIATNLIFTFINICINLIFKIISSRLIPKEDLGLFFSVVDIFSLTLLLLVGFRSSMIVSFAKTHDESNIVNIFRYFFIVTILATWAFVLPYVKHKIGVDIHYWYLVFMIISMGLVAYFGNLVAMHREYNTINTTTILEPILGLSWFIIAYYVAGVSGYQTLFISSIMSSLGVAFYMWRKQYSQKHITSFKSANLSPQMKDFLKNSMISTLEFGSGVVMIYLSVMLIIHYFSQEALGDFQVVVKSIFVYMIMLFVFPIFRFIMPELSQLIQNKEYSKIKKLKKEVYIFAFTVSAIFLAVMWVFGQSIVIYLFTQKYASAYIMLIHLSFFYVFTILNAYNISYIKASGKFWWALWVRLSGSIAMLCIFFILHIFSKSVIIVILSLIWGYMIMFIISFWLEVKLRKNLANT